MQLKAYKTMWEELNKKLDEIKELADMELHCCNDTNTTKSMKKMLQIIERE